jgi:hypothetical protein
MATRAFARDHTLTLMRRVLREAACNNRRTKS